MKTIEILGENRFETFSKTRAGSRAVILRDGKILLSHETVSGWWLIPGGGLEEDETPEECCIRETEEETGFIVKPLRQFLTMKEYYGPTRKKDADLSRSGSRFRKRSNCFPIIRITPIPARKNGDPTCGNTPP